MIFKNKKFRGKDITNFRSGMLVAKFPASSNNHGIVWECQCDCGKTKKVISGAITSNRAKSCGCLRETDLSNTKCGKLLVIEFTGKRDKSRRRIWSCKCDCGNIIEVTTTDIKLGRKTSCGCNSDFNLIGKSFGKLTVIEQLASDSDNKSVWKCFCNCGNLVDLKRCQLMRGYSKSCGCDKINYEYKDVSNHCWKSLLSNAAARGFSVNISPQYAYDLLEKQNWKCALTGLTIKLSKNITEQRNKETTASLDRIDSKLGYIINNVQWVHKTLNKIKQDLNEVEFFSICEKVFFQSLVINGKPSWDTYFLNLAKMVAVRSIDPNTKIGCVIVSEKNRVLSLGYNGPIQDINDEIVPLIRPKKYLWMLHAEQNAILFCNGDTNNSTAYITGKPCSTCIRMLIQKGIKRIVAGNIMPKCVDAEDESASLQMLKAANVKLEFINS